MPLSPIRSDACAVDQRNRLRRFEILACGCLGRALTRMRPEQLSWTWGGIDYTPEQLAWMGSWPEPTHALLERPSLKVPPARSRRCQGSCEDLPEWLEVIPLVLHAWGDACQACNPL